VGALNKIARVKKINFSHPQTEKNREKQSRVKRVKEGIQRNRPEEEQWAKVYRKELGLWEYSGEACFDMDREKLEVSFSAFKKQWPTLR